MTLSFVLDIVFAERFLKEAIQLLLLNTTAKSAVRFINISI